MYYVSKKWNRWGPVEGLAIRKEGGYYEGTFERFSFGKGIFVHRYGNSQDGERRQGKLEGLVKLSDCSGHSFYCSFSLGKICEVDGSFENKLNPFLLKCIEMNLCTRAYTKTVHFPQSFYRCVDCNFTKENHLGVCSTCALVCHKGHKLEKHKSSSFFCDCHSKSLCFCYEVNKDYTSLGIPNLEQKVVFHPLTPLNSLLSN